MFDELLTPSPSVDLPAPEVIALVDEVVAPVPAVSTGSPSSTNVDQDTPSASNSQTTPETQPPIIPNDVEVNNHDIEVNIWVLIRTLKWTMDYAVEYIYQCTRRTVSTGCSYMSKLCSVTMMLSSLAVDPRRYKML
ncbi:hypothetical protein Tco_1042032 [Tanacetum coccineum]|uniref:Uncharacterized protein n=1 Tax=Tanacetum coccineum TaxID=301880 RepID=A0ABQ5GK84_9ASTR